VLGRWLIRIAASLIGIAAGLVLAVALLSDFSASTKAIVTATLLFWIVHIIVNFFAVKVLIRQPSVAMAGLLALASTIVALVIVNLVISGISIHGVATYVLATLIIWITTAVADVIAGRMIRDRRSKWRG
jgi:small-conductance mechanosensitive channel